MVIEKIHNITDAVTNSTLTNVTETDSVCLATVATVPLLIDQNITTNGNGTATIIEGPLRIDNQKELNATTIVGSAPSSVLQAGTASFSKAGGDKNSLAFIKTQLANLNEIPTEFDEGIHKTSNVTTINNSSSGHSDTSGNGFGSDNITDAETNETEDSLYECNICLDTAQDAVVSMCGHLFCWPCLHQLLKFKPNRKLCPVCKACVDKDKVIPLFGRNCVNKEDPRYKLPPRAAGQEAGFSFGNGFFLSFEVGAFPFGCFTSLNIGSRQTAATRATTQFHDEQALSKLFLYLAFICMIWILLT